MTTLRKGQILRRKSDGFLFVVKTAPRFGGAFLQCVDAAAIFGWYPPTAIKLSFERVSKAEVPS